MCDVVSLPFRLLAAVLLASGSSGGTSIRAGVAQPNTVQERLLTLRWALVRGEGTVRAVGMAQSAGGLLDATVALEGVDSQGHVVSRSTGSIRRGFGPGPTAFAVDLAPRGGETDFRLRVISVQEITGPGR
jgi:hypothetical protein